MWLRACLVVGSAAFRAPARGLRAPRTRVFVARDDDPRASDAARVAVLCSVPVVWGTYAPAVKAVYALPAPPPGAVFSLFYYVVALGCLGTLGRALLLAVRKEQAVQQALPRCLHRVGGSGRREARLRRESQLCEGHKRWVGPSLLQQIDALARRGRRLGTSRRLLRRVHARSHGASQSLRGASAARWLSRRGWHFQRTTWRAEVRGAKMRKYVTYLFRGGKL